MIETAIDAALDIAGLLCLFLGGGFFLIGAIGLNRMPDLFTRMHAVSVADTAGFGLMILGMCLQAGPTLVAVKLIFILVVVLFTGAVGAHALARAALHDGEKPILAGPRGGLKPTDPADLFPVLKTRLAEPLTSETVNVPAPGAKSGDGGGSEDGFGDGFGDESGGGFGGESGDEFGDGFGNDETGGTQPTQKKGRAGPSNS